MAAPAPDVRHEDLVGRCVAGDRAAWQALHRLHRPMVRAFLRRLGVPPREAEDACQDVFLQVFRYLPGFERRADLRTWIYKLCISQAARQRRRVWRWPWQAAHEPSEDLAWSRDRAAAAAERALQAMGTRLRTVFVLFELEGLSSAQVAELVGRPDATVRRQIQDARRLFEAHFTEEDAAPSRRQDRRGP